MTISERQWMVMNIVNDSCYIVAVCTCKERGYGVWGVGGSMYMYAWGRGCQCIVVSSYNYLEKFRSLF